MYGVIDIGSTSVRLMLTDGVKVEKQLNTTRLAENMGNNGTLQPTNLERSAQAVAEYYYRALSRGAEDVFIFATEAVRSARNKNVFLARVKELCGAEVDVLSKENEAKIGFLGAYDGGVCCVIDMGGASTEVSVGDASGIIYSKSVPYGIVRLTDLAQHGIDLYSFVKGVVQEFGDVPAFQKVVAIGGTAGTMASMLEGMELYNPNLANGYKVTLDAIYTMYQKLKDMSSDERKRVPGLPEKRADIITSGLMMYGLILKKLGVDYLKVSEGDNLEGYLINKGLLPEGFKAIYT